MVSPGVEDLLVAPEPARAVNRAGGVRGYVDFGRLRATQVSLAFAGSAFSSTLVDQAGELSRAFCESIPSMVDAPEVGLSAGEYAFRVSAVVSVGNTLLTEDQRRCARVGGAPGSSAHGCFLATQAQHRSDRLFAFGARPRITELTKLASALFPAEDVSCLETAGVLLSFVGGNGHGVLERVAIPEAPMRSRGGAGVDCTDPEQPRYREVCQPDYDAFVRHDVSLAAPRPLLTEVQIPPLPEMTTGSFAEGVVLIASALLPDQDLLPLGIRVGFDVQGAEQADGLVGGTEGPFGPASPPTPDGRMPLSISAPHDGVEAAPIGLTALALPRQGLNLGARADHAMLTKRAHGVHTLESFGTSFLPLPNGELVRATRQLRLTNTSVGPGLLRVRATRGELSWTILAPVAPLTELPDLPPLDAVLGAGGRLLVSHVRVGHAEFGDMVARGSATHFSHLAEQAQVQIATRQCAEGAGEACQIR